MIMTNSRIVSQFQQFSSIMIEEKEKKLVPYELYMSKKLKNGDPFTEIMNKKRKQKLFELQSLSQLDKDTLVKQINEKRIAQLRKQYKKTNQVTPPQPYIKRTFISPYLAEKNSEKNTTFRKIQLMNWKYAKRNQQNTLGQKQNEQFQKVYHCLNMNSKLHYFGDFMYSEFDEQRSGKQNCEYTGKNLNNKPKILEQLYREYLRLEQMDKKIMVCSPNTKFNKFYNPLKEDKYYTKIMKKQDQQLMRILIQILSNSNYFNFSSFINFYQIFVWQQSTKNTQIDFVLRLLMKQAESISQAKLCERFDFFCTKIKLPGTGQNLVGFSEVMKKLLLGQYYDKRDPEYNVTREELRENLQRKQECISIFINVFYCE